MKPMLSIFQYASKFDYQFLAFFQNFFWFISFIFDKFASPSLNIRYKIFFRSIFKSILEQKTVSEVLKTWYFLYSAICSASQFG